MDNIDDRAAGVLLGQAIGDALGVPYEFKPLVKAGDAKMLGGGLGDYEPGEWSDDTQMAACIAQVAATDDLTSPDTLDAVGEAFLRWKAGGPADIGIQTSTVLGRAAHDDGRPLHERMTAVAEEIGRQGKAGNGGLMRTAVVGLCALDSAEKTAEAARLVCALTHDNPDCVESAVLWSLAVRQAVLTGELDVRAGLASLPDDRRAWWAQKLDDAEANSPGTFTPNGYTVTALQAAWAAIFATGDVAGAARVPAALQLAISIGDDTDTVAAIAGGLLGAAYGASQLPHEWVQMAHGWPGLNADDLQRLGVAIAGRHVRALQQK